MEREGTSGAAPATASEKSAPVKAAVSLSPKAIDAAKKQLAKRGTPNAAIRLGLKGGGCSGFSYVIEFSDDPPRERDRVFDFDGVKVFVDPKSLIYLAGTVLDWEQTLMYQGFKFRNPNEATNCGCGHSFSV
ncbi:MAG TPA: iron-sulfur cluster assembly accessory protein [Polyangiaceae bacterium]|jgi:iron-sulfur cluster assembly protein|nr:iron-sulfur cluster assembly accessory protein [Polyangiaceae bacterium]